MHYIVQLYTLHLSRPQWSFMPPSLSTPLPSPFSPPLPLFFSLFFPPSLLPLPSLPLPPFPPPPPSSLTYSTDRTAKVWDLKSGMEVQTLEKHLSYVRVIRYSSAKRLVFTACQSMIKIWDMRNYRSKCIKTFGLVAYSYTNFYTAREHVHLH